LEEQMKNYRYLIPAALILLMILSTYKLISDAAKKKEAYYGYIEEARDYAGQGITVDAIESYQNALKMYPTLELYLEVGNHFKENELDREAVDWGESLIKRYPKDAGSYEYLLDEYMELQDYKSCFRLNSTMKKRNVTSGKLKEMIDSIQYVYTMDYSTFANVSVFSEDRCAVQDKDGMWGYIDNTGSIRIGTKYKSAGAYGSKLAAVQDEDGALYYIDPEGNKKRVPDLDIKYNTLGYVGDEVFTASDGTSYGFYDMNYNKLSGPYEYAGTLNLNVAAVKNNKKWMLADRNGQPLNTVKYQNIKLDEKEIAYRNERAFVQIENKYYMVDGTGNQVTNIAYQDAKTFLSQSYAPVKQNGKWGFTDADGNMVIKPMYEDARGFINGLAAVKSNGSWGYINEENEMVIESSFEDAMDFNNDGCAFIKQQDQWSLLILFSHNYD